MAGCPTQRQRQQTAENRRGQNWFNSLPFVEKCWRKEKRKENNFKDNNKMYLCGEKGEQMRYRNIMSTREEMHYLFFYECIRGLCETVCAHVAIIGAFWTCLPAHPHMRLFSSKYYSWGCLQSCHSSERTPNGVTQANVGRLFAVICSSEIYTCRTLSVIHLKDNIWLKIMSNKAVLKRGVNYTNSIRLENMPLCEKTIVCKHLYHWNATF